MKESAPQRLKGFFGALLAALGLTLSLSLLAGNFPPVNCDEAFLANHAFNLYHGHSNRYSLYDDLFEPSLPQYRDAQAGVLQIVYEGWIGPFVSGPHKSLRLVRASSLVAGFFCLLLLYGIGARLTGSSAGGWVCLLLAAAHPTFWLGTSLVRAEVPLLTAYVGLLTLLQVIPERFLWKYGLIGGQRDIARWLGGWKPDVIIIESSWKRMLLGSGDTLPLLQMALPYPVHQLGSVETGAGNEGLFEIFSIDWKIPGRDRLLQ